MPKLAQSKGDDYPDAAEKHLADADLLFHAGRFDGAGYLTGYVVECVLKTYILVEGTKPWGHDLNELSLKSLSLAAIPSGRTAKYPLKVTAGHSIYDKQTGWCETIRYRAPAVVPPQQAMEWLAEAHAIYAPAIQQMKLDGLV
ncbi:MAG: HEPN domain-containing protein [Planctomycetota bacterium]